MSTSSLKAEFALAQALLCVRATDGDLEMGIASYPYPKEVTRRYLSVFEPMDIAAPCTFDMTGDVLYTMPPLLTPDQACFSGTFRADFNAQFERRRAHVRRSWLARWEASDPVKAAAFAERAAETLYTVSALIGEAAVALASPDTLEADARAEQALPHPKGDFDAPLPERYTTILCEHFHSDGFWTAVATDKAMEVLTPTERAALGVVRVPAVLDALLAGRTEEAALGGLAAARAVAAAARALQRRLN